MRVWQIGIRAGKIGRVVQSGAQSPRYIYRCLNEDGIKRNTIARRAEILDVDSRCTAVQPDNRKLVYSSTQAARIYFNPCRIGANSQR
jgi:hypothetical protein